MIKIDIADKFNFKIKQFEEKFEKAPNRWGINHNVEGINNPKVQAILTRMDNIRQMSPQERSKLESDINSLDDDNPLLKGMTGTLLLKKDDVLKNTFMYPHIMDDNELIEHLELSSNVSNLSKIIVDATQNFKDMFDIKNKTTQKYPRNYKETKFLLSHEKLKNMPPNAFLFLVEMSSDSILNHYSDREKKYMAEMVKRGLINEK